MKAGWEVKKLEDVCYFQNGFAFKSNLFLEKGRPIIRISNIQNQQVVESDLVYFNEDDYKENFDKFKVSKGDILIAMSGGITGKIGVNTLDKVFYLNQRVGKFSPKKSLLNQYLYYYLLTKTEESLIISAGSAQPNLSTEQIKNFLVPSPSMQEQQRIITILDQAFEGIAKARANAEQNLQNTRALFESHLQSVFTQRGVGWLDSKLGEVCDLFQGLCINAKTKHLLVEKSSLPLLRIKDLRDDSAELFIAETGWPKNAYVSKSEIIYTRTGQIGLVFRGRVGVLHNNCFKVTPKPALNEDYIFWWLQNPAFRAKITVLASKTAQPDITHLLFKAQPILVPPRAYQDQAIDTINKMRIETQRLEALYKRKIACLDELKKSLLQQAFAGAL